MAEFLDLVVWAAAIALAVVVGHFAYEVTKKGWGWGLTQLHALFAKLKGWWSKGKADVSTLKGDLAGFESRVAKLEADVSAIKPKVGL